MSQEETRSISTKIELVIQKIGSMEVQLNKMEERLNNQFVLKESFDSVKDRVQNLEDSNTWITRLVLGLVVTAIVGAVIVIKF